MSAGLAMMPWFPGDFMRSTRGWSVTAKGVYREMLDAQWDLGSLPANLEELCALIGATAAEWSKGWLKCECKFPVGEDGQRRNPVLQEHLTKSLRLAERHAKGAAATNAKRYGERTPSDTLNGHSALAQRDAQRSPPSPSPSPSPSPYHLHTNKNGEDSRAAVQPSGDAEFDILKRIYPKRGGSQRWPDARKAIKARLAQGHTWQEIYDGAERYAAYIRATGKERTEHVQQAATFVGTNKSFLEPWELPASKADVRLSSNLTAAEEFMRRTEPSNETH